MIPEPSAFLVMMLSLVSSGWTLVVADALHEQQAPQTAPGCTLPRRGRGVSDSDAAREWGSMTIGWLLTPLIFTPRHCLSPA
jgi:hypothetical protein